MKIRSFPYFLYRIRTLIQDRSLPFFLLIITFLTIYSNNIVFGADESRTNFESLKKILVHSEFLFEELPTPSCHASTIAQSSDGTLVTAWFGGTQEGMGDVAIWSSRQEHGQWSRPRVIADAQEEDVPCWNPVLFQPKQGPLCLFYKVSKQITTWKGELVVSEDNGKTWKDRKELPEGFLGPIKNKPVELANGIILCPSSSEHDGWCVHVERLPRWNAEFSQWTRTDALNTKEEGGAIQPSILFHSDGQLQMICRNKIAGNSLWQFWSKDQGKTWSRMTPLGLPNPCSGTDAVTLQDGRHLLVYNHTGTKGSPRYREMLNVAVSDNGIDWKAVCVLENRSGEFSYPAVIQTKDSLVHITYTWRRIKIRHVVLDPAKITGTPIVNGQWPKTVQ